VDFLGINKIWIIGAAVAIVVGLGGIAIYTWRGDIKQAAYDHIFREMAKVELDEKDREIKRLNEFAEGKEKAIVAAQTEKRLAQAKVDALTGLLRGQTYAQEPVSPGLTRALDAIQDYGRAVPAPIPSPTGRAPK